MDSKYSVFLFLLVVGASIHALPGKNLKESGPMDPEMEALPEPTKEEPPKEVPAAVVPPAVGATETESAKPVGEDAKLFFPMISFGGKPVAVIAPPPPPPPPPAQLIVIPPNTPISVTSPGLPITITQGAASPSTSTTIVTSGKK